MIKKCKECGELKKHHARGLCYQCYNKVYGKKYRMINQVRYTIKKQISNIENKLFLGKGRINDMRAEALTLRLDYLKGELKKAYKK